jgi:hypothetical protein
MSKKKYSPAEDPTKFRNVCTINLRKHHDIGAVMIGFGEDLPSGEEGFNRLALFNQVALTDEQVDKAVKRVMKENPPSDKSKPRELLPGRHVLDSIDGLPRPKKKNTLGLIGFKPPFSALHNMTTLHFEKHVEWLDQCKNAEFPDFVEAASQCSADPHVRVPVMISCFSPYLTSLEEMKQDNSLDSKVSCDGKVYPPNMDDSTWLKNTSLYQTDNDIVFRPEALLNSIKAYKESLLSGEAGSQSVVEESKETRCPVLPRTIFTDGVTASLLSDQRVVNIQYNFCPDRPWIIESIVLAIQKTFWKAFMKEHDVNIRQFVSWYFIKRAGCTVWTKTKEQEKARKKTTISASKSAVSTYHNMMGMKNTPIVTLLV